MSKLQQSVEEANFYIYRGLIPRWIGEIQTIAVVGTIMYGVYRLLENGIGEEAVVSGVCIVCTYWLYVLYCLLYASYNIFHDCTFVYFM